MEFRLPQKNNTAFRFRSRGLRVDVREHTRVRCFSGTAADVAQARVDGDNWTVPYGHRRPAPVCSLSATAPHREHLFWGDTMPNMSRRSANTYGAIGKDSRHRFRDPDFDSDLCCRLIDNSAETRGDYECTPEHLCAGTDRRLHGYTRYVVSRVALPPPRSRS